MDIRPSWDWLKRNGISTMISALFYGGLGFVSAQALMADEMRKQAELNHRESLASIENNVSMSVEKSLKPLKRDIQDNLIKPLKESINTDLEKAMLLCTESAFRSIRAANTVQQASDTASSVFDAQKDALRKELEK